MNACFEGLVVISVYTGNIVNLAFEKKPEGLFLHIELYRSLDYEVLVQNIPTNQTTKVSGLRIRH